MLSRQWLGGPGQDQNRSDKLLEPAGDNTTRKNHEKPDSTTRVSSCPRYPNPSINSMSKPQRARSGSLKCAESNGSRSPIAFRKNQASPPPPALIRSASGLPAAGITAIGTRSERASISGEVVSLDLVFDYRSSSGAKAKPFGRPEKSENVFFPLVRIGRRLRHFDGVLGDELLEVFDRRLELGVLTLERARAEGCPRRCRDRRRAPRSARPSPVRRPPSRRPRRCRGRRGRC